MTRSVQLPAQLGPRMSIKVYGERDASRTDQQAPGLVGSDFELPVLHRAARDLAGDLVLARLQIDFLAVGRFASGCGVVRQVASSESRQLDGLLVDGDDGLFIRGVAEQQPHLP